MADYEYDIGVIGGGAAGLTVTSGSAQLGAKTLLIEKEKVLGGDCLHFGCVPSKTLIKTAHVYHMMKTAEKYGLPRVSIPPVDFETVSNRIKSVISVIQKHDSEERFCNLGAKVEFGDPVFLDEHSVRLNGKTVSAKNWVIATGSSPFVPPIKGLDKTSYITNKDIFYMDHLPKSMIIIGGGPIGSEMGQAFNRLGTKVYIVDLGDQILAKEDKDMADTIKQVMESEGVLFYLNASVEAVKDVGYEKEVIIKNNEGKSVTLKAETVMVAVGRTPNIHGLGLEGIDVKVNRAGIEVDKRLRTNHKHIYAAGDVAEYVDIARSTPWVNAIWPEAVNQGRIAGLNMAGRRVTYPGSLSRNVIRIFDLDIMAAGVVNPPQDALYRKLVFKNANKKLYRKLVFQGDYLVGMVMVNGIEQGGLLLASQGPVSVQRERPRFASFPPEEKAKVISMSPSVRSGVSSVPLVNTVTYMPGWRAWR